MIIPNRKEKQKKHNSIYPHWSVYAVILIIVLLTFLFMQPKVSSTLFQPKRALMLEQFVDSVKTRQAVDPRVYWEFREFYSPGYFVFERTGLSQTTVDEFISKSPLSMKKQSISHPFLQFQSPYVYSIDSLTTQKSIDDFIDTKMAEKENVLKKNNTVFLYKYDSNTLMLVFVLPESEMKKANGFFDYRENDKDLVKDKNWLNITFIKQE